MLILYIIVAIIAGVLLVAAILPKTFELKADTTIRASKDAVWNYVKLLANQKNYSVRVMADPNIKLTYAGTDGTVGAKQARDSADKNVGAGEQEITQIDAGNSYEVEVRFERPMKATNYAKTSLEDVGAGMTRVTNIFFGKNPRPGNLISRCFFPKVQKDMQQNMDNLKVQLEK